MILQSHTPTGKAVAFSHDGALLAVGDTMNFIHLWQGNFTNGAACRHQTLNGHTNSIQSIAFRPDARLLAGDGSDGTVKLWDARTGECINALELPKPYTDMNIKSVTGITEAQRVALQALSAVETAESVRITAS